MKKVYITPYMFPCGHEPKEIHEDEKGTYFLCQEQKKKKKEPVS